MVYKLTFLHGVFNSTLAISNSEVGLNYFHKKKENQVETHKFGLTKIQYLCLSIHLSSRR